MSLPPCRVLWSAHGSHWELLEAGLSFTISVACKGSGVYWGFINFFDQRKRWECKEITAGSSLTASHHAPSTSRSLLVWASIFFLFLAWQLLFILQVPACMLTPLGSLPDDFQPVWFIHIFLCASTAPCTCIHQKENVSMTICIQFLFGLPGLTSRLNFMIFFCLMLLPEHCLKWSLDILTICYYICYFDI